MVSTSLTSRAPALELPPRWIPRPVVWQNYARAWTVLPFADFTRNSLIYACATLVGQLISCSLVAYGFARIRFRGRGFWFIILLATMMLPSQVTLIPQFILFRNLQLAGHPAAPDRARPGSATPSTSSCCASSSSPCRPSWTTPPASTAPTPSRSIWYIILPLATPALATVAIFSFLYHWNDFFGPLIYLTTPEKMTIAVGLQLFRGQWGTDFSLLMAASSPPSLPIIALFFVAQKTFIQGIALTGVKG